MLNSRNDSFAREPSKAVQIHDSKPKKRRASFACVPCNQRRLKCDVVERGAPCTRCRSGGKEKDCQIHESKRGKYPRAGGKGGQRASPSPNLLSELSPLAMISDVAASQPILSISSSSTTDNVIAETAQEWIERATTEEGDVNGNNAENNELRESSPAFSTRPPSPKAPTDMIYADLYDNDRKSEPQSHTIFYMGHSTHNMSYIVNQKGGVNPPLLHYPIVDGLNTRKPISAEELTFYRSRGDYELPPQAIQDELIRTYFTVVQPTYPIIDRIQFARSYKNQSCPPSLLLLQAMFMVSSTHCPMDVILRMGFKTRYEAKRTFYRRARGLFDADYESNRIVNIQATFLLQFWWESPIEQKDSGYWLNLAIFLAQQCGMHRCTERASSLSPSDRRLWRRIWTCLCIRDGQMSLAFGKPFQIQATDCDVEPMTADDFVEETDVQVDSSLFPPFSKQHIRYSLTMARLHKIDVLILQAYSPSRDRNTIDEAKSLLYHWNKTLEPEMQHEANPHPDFWVRILHIFSSYLTLLIERAETIARGEGLSSHSSQAVRAANFINLLFDELTLENEIHMCPTHLVPALFSAMLIHLSMAGFLDPVVRVDRGAKIRLRMSLSAMKELSAFWPVSTWIFQLSAKIKERSGRAHRRPSQTAISSPTLEKNTEQTLPTPRVPTDDIFGNWAEIEEFTSNFASTDGMNFDFSHMFEMGDDGIITFNGETLGTPARDTLFNSGFVGS